MAVLRAYDDFGAAALDLVRPSSRFWEPDRVPTSSVTVGADPRRLLPVPSPSALLASPPGEPWLTLTRRTQHRLHAWFLVYEDPQRRLDAKPVATLAHQASLVHHVLQQPDLERVLIADEVGLGKTVEAGLLIRELLRANPGLRILYLAPARLVRNVQSEFRRLELTFRIWVAGEDRDARLDDPRVIASIHRAAHERHRSILATTTTWDLIVVDECHHLSAWEPNQGKPVRKYKLVMDLIARLRPGGRVVLLSGTPHQGSKVRFENLVALLRSEREPPEAIAGRVIYRTKDDVRDWEGQPLFPARQVNEPLTIDLGPEHRAWIERIHNLFEPPRPDQHDRTPEVRRRAAGWRTGVALQWATSSIQAGIGFLIRQALRAGWDLDTPILAQAAAALRPYRDGAADESPSALLERMLSEIRPATPLPVEATDDEDDLGGPPDLADVDLEESPWRPDPEGLATCLAEGLEVLAKVGDRKWQTLFERVLSQAGTEKVVLFAQPIETVNALSAYLERRSGKHPARIVGQQTEGQRQQELESFWRDDGPQFLVSSRAGGEGLNLQVARRLVHVDVPWNPMELEQRVGRVHRFGSRRTILVDTLVVKDSREVDCYRVARRKLQTIASTLVPVDRFEGLFTRVMALVPPEDLAELMGERPTGPLTEGEERRLSEMVSSGFAAWQEFDDRFKAQQVRIQALDPGEASWQDLAEFATQHLGARPADGFSSLGFRFAEGGPEEASRPVPVLQIGGTPYAASDSGGMPITGPGGIKAGYLGLNQTPCLATLARLGFPDSPTGAAQIRWRGPGILPGTDGSSTFGLLVFARQAVRNTQGNWIEGDGRLSVYLVREACEPSELTGPAKAQAIRGLVGGVVRRSPEAPGNLVRDLARHERALLESLRQPSSEEREQGVRFAIFPLAAAVVQVGRGPGGDPAEAEDPDEDAG